MTSRGFVLFALGTPQRHREPLSVAFEIGEGPVALFRLQTVDRIRKAPLVVHSLPFFWAAGSSRRPTLPISVSARRRLVQYALVARRGGIAHRAGRNRTPRRRASPSRARIQCFQGAAPDFAASADRSLPPSPGLTLGLTRRSRGEDQDEGLGERRQRPIPQAPHPNPLPAEAGRGVARITRTEEEHTFAHMARSCCIFCWRGQRTLTLPQSKDGRPPGRLRCRRTIRSRGLPRSRRGRAPDPRNCRSPRCA